ncbi:hypothetical protein Nepgr_015475 [Nepenthes gracilis]|uniref:Uncharacterized protein n=1 Tax=Nepenthes gracilis TaxID=150966 RepID=A0AAD3XR53_NEPGR|nr:hypothetical protein Nepgr_015475 [Nepenthes gracilis]
MLLISFSIKHLGMGLDAEENFTALSEFQAGKDDFESKIIQRIELLVLNTLQWNLASITPFAYQPRFINQIFNEPPPHGIISRTVELILATMRDINLMDHSPSAIVSAAITEALGKRLTRKEMEMSTMASHEVEFLILRMFSIATASCNNLRWTKLKFPSCYFLYILFQ